MKINRQGKSRTLTTEELDLVNKYLPSEKHKLISLVLRKTAGRISEVVALRYENLTATTILIPKEITKGKLKPREIPISKDLFLKLQEWKVNCMNQGEEVSPKDFIFKGRNGHITSRAFQKVLSNAVLKADLRGFSSHGYRRSSLSAGSDAGIPIRHLAELSGHQSMSVLQEYLTVKRSHLEKAVEAFA
jgi:integrase/recombinase XerD